jgi:hypothetical protein
VASITRSTTSLKVQDVVYRIPLTFPRLLRLPYIQLLMCFIASRRPLCRGRIFRTRRREKPDENRIPKRRVGEQRNSKALVNLVAARNDGPEGRRGGRIFRFYEKLVPYFNSAVTSAPWRCNIYLVKGFERVFRHRYTHPLLDKRL